MGGEELDTSCLFYRLNLTRDINERAFLVEVFPLTPLPPTP